MSKASVSFSVRYTLSTIVARAHLVKSGVFPALLAFAGVLGYTIELQAQAPIDIHLSVAPREVTVGEVMTFTLQVTHPKDSRVVPLRMDEQWGPFEIRRLEPVRTEDKPVETAGALSVQRIQATLWATGTFTSPRTSLKVINPEGTESVYPIEPVTVNVRSVLQTGDETLRDIKPQASLPIPSLWRQLFSGLGVIALLGLILWWWHQRQARSQRADVAEGPPVVARPAHLVALDELQRIEELQLPTQRRFAEHYDLVTDVLRRYLTAVTDLNALDQTTSELRQTLRQSLLEPQDAAHLLQLLEDADLVKFAKAEPDFGAAARLAAKAKQIVLSVDASQMRYFEHVDDKRATERAELAEKRRAVLMHSMKRSEEERDLQARTRVSDRGS